MEENVRSLLAQECFYFRTSLNWAVSWQPSAWMRRREAVN